MKRIIFFIIYHSLVYGLSIDNEALLIECQAVGHTLYSSCIATPPATPAQAGVCSAIYANYLKCATLLNAPYPLIISRDPDLYTWSPYDPCRFEIGHQILIDICPTLPIAN